MPKTNLSLGNLYRAVSGSVRTGAVSLGGLAGSLANSSLGSFAIDSVTPTPPTFTYIVESTTETAGFTFGTPGALHGSKVGTVAANYSVTFENANFSVGSPTLGATPSFPITPAAIGASTYSEAQATISMSYADGYNLNATNYNVRTTKLLYAVDVYNTINQPDFCLLFGTQIELANGTMVNVEDLNVGDVIKAWVPEGLPDETLDGSDTNQTEWRFYYSDTLSGSAQTVTVSDITFNFASAYYSLNNGTIEATETHPIYVWDAEIQKYRFKIVGDILPGDKLVKQDGTEEEVYDVAIVRQDIEIATINVENADVYISNGLISHNKGTTTQPFIPSTGLRMYLDPSKASSTSGDATTDWLDLSGWGTGFRPAGQGASAGITGKSNPAYNNGASRKEKWWQGATNAFWFKDATTNINGGYTQFNTNTLSVVAWVRFASHPANGFYNIFNKQDVSGTRILSLYLNSNGSGTYYIHEGSALQYNSSTFSLTTNVWYMISYTVATNGTNVGYLDKTSQGTISNGVQAYTTGALLQIGGNYAENNYYFTGQIGPVLFYNTQLTSTQIGQIYDYFSPTYKV